MKAVKFYQKLNNVSMVDKIIAVAQAKKNWSESSFSLNDVNHMLATWREDDFNAFKAPVVSVSDFNAMVNAAIEAKSNPDAPWLMLKCDCGREYTISHRELLWRRRVKVGLPCMCEDCMRMCLGEIE